MTLPSTFEPYTGHLRHPTTRRHPTDDEPPITKEHGRWLSHDDLLNIGKQHFDEQRLRDKHPALQEAWEKYQLILALVKDENSYKTHKPSEK